MKRILVISICTVLVSAYFACQRAEKDTHAITGNLPPSISRDGVPIPGVTNGRLVFQSPQAMEDYVLSLSGKNLDSIENTLNIASFRKYSNGDFWNAKIDSDFSSALNRDSIVQVGTDVFKLVFHDRRVYVMRNSPSEGVVASMRNAKNFDEMPPGTLSFSFDASVFEDLDQDSGQNQDSLCGEKCTEKDKEKDNDKDYCEGHPSGFDFNYKFKVKYGRIGIWNWLTLKFKHKCQGKCDDGTQSFPQNEATDFDVEYDARWKKKCKTASSSKRVFKVCNQSNLCGGSFPEAGTEFSRTFYDGMRCLSSFSLEGQVRFRSRCDNSTVLDTERLRVEGN